MVGDFMIIHEKSEDYVFLRSCNPYADEGGCIPVPVPFQGELEAGLQSVCLAGNPNSDAIARLLAKFLRRNIQSDERSKSHENRGESIWRDFVHDREHAHSVRELVDDNRTSYEEVFNRRHVPSGLCEWRHVAIARPWRPQR